MNEWLDDLSDPRPDNVTAPAFSFGASNSNVEHLSDCEDASDSDDMGQFYNASTTSSYTLSKDNSSSKDSIGTHSLTSYSASTAHQSNRKRSGKQKKFRRRWKNTKKPPPPTSDNETESQHEEIIPSCPMSASHEEDDEYGYEEDDDDDEDEDGDGDETQEFSSNERVQQKEEKHSIMDLVQSLSLKAVTTMEREQKEQQQQSSSSSSCYSSSSCVSDILANATLDPLLEQEL